MSSEGWSVEQINTILQSTHYRELLRVALNERARTGRALSFAELSRRGGFRSRSFPRDVLGSTRGLTRESARRFAKAFGFPSVVSTYLYALVDLDREQESLELRKKAQVLQARAIRKIRARTENAPKNAFVLPEFSKVYAALGSPARGATLEEIEKRTKLSRKELLRTLEALIESQLVVEEEGRWKAKQNILLFDNLSKHEFFQKVFLRRLKNAQVLAQTQFQRDDALFWESTFSISSKRLPELRVRLREVLGRFIEEAEEFEGDQISSVAVSFFPLD